MYNGIGLATPRGSGTSGYVQRNLAYIKPSFKGKADFTKELKRLRQNVIPARRKANPEILLHKQKREIYL